MPEEMGGSILSEDLKNNVQKPENIGAQSEVSTSKEELVRKAEQVERELNRIEEVMGISAQETMEFYETITPEDAKIIVAKTIEQIPMGFMKGTLWTVDTINKIGGKVILWASVKSPIDAPIIAASVMILTIGGWQTAVEGDSARQKSIPEVEAMSVSEKQFENLPVYIEEEKADTTPEALAGSELAEMDIEQQENWMGGKAIFSSHVHVGNVIWQN